MRSTGLGVGEVDVADRAVGVLDELRDTGVAGRTLGARAGQLTVEPVPSVQTVGAALVRKLVKLAVVPELSQRCTTVIVVLGSFAFGLSALIAASFQVVI